jgi:periplasmic divalent cation tolerance protein
VIDHLEVSTTAGSREDAGCVAKAAVTAKLAVSARVVGPVSAYTWFDGDLEEGKKWRVFLRIRADRYPELEALLRVEQPRDNFEVIAIPLVDDSDEYYSWIDRAADPDV